MTPEGVLRADVALEDGRITAIAPELSGGDEEIDARGLTVLPGLIDAHVHFNEPGRTDWEGAATGSRALAAGGGTLFFDMPLNSSPCTVGPAEFDEKRVALERASITDFALWGGIVPGNRDALPELACRGVIGFKAFMCDSGLPEFPRSDDLTLYEAMCAAASLGLPVAVHAESQEITASLARRAIEEDRLNARDYRNSRPVMAEVEAIQRACLLAREAGARLHIVHVSSGRGVAAALEERASGTDVSIETCAHYLYFTEEDVERIGAAAKCAPPLRTAAERDSLWGQVMQGKVDIVDSDHSPAPVSMKQGADFFRIWGGIAGVQSTLAVLLDRGLQWSRIAHVTASMPASRFNLSQKGSIALGNDADVVIIEPEARFELHAADLHQRHPISPYIGASFRGRVRRTIAAGETLYADGQITATRRGRFIRPAKESTCNR